MYNLLSVVSTFYGIAKNYGSNEHKIMVVFNWIFTFFFIRKVYEHCGKKDQTPNSVSQNSSK